MHEIIDQKLIDFLGKFPDQVLNIVLLSAENCADMNGHRQAVIAGMKIIAERHETWPIEIYPEKIKGEICSLVEFFTEEKSEKLSFYSAFTEPPHALPYKSEDFELLKQTLFSSPENLEIYRWADDFSNYFEVGKEWWGTGFWTIYDKSQKHFVVIGASSTD